MNGYIRPNDGHAQGKNQASHALACGTTNKFDKLKIISPAAMAKLVIDRASTVSCKKKSGDFHSKSGDREIFIILSKIGRSPAKSGDLEALTFTHAYTVK